MKIVSRDPNAWKVLIGTNCLNSGGSIHTTDTIIMHEKHDNKNRTNDIALLHMTSPIEFTEKVQPIELNEDVITPGTKLQAFGWGRTEVI